MNEHQIEVEQISDPRWPRWIIKNSGFVYTGSTWSENRRDALVFAEQTLAEQLRQRLHDDELPRIFQVSLSIEVKATRPFSIQQIRDYLERNARIQLGDDEGDHPCDFAEYEFHFPWHVLEEGSR